ncbi:MAG TPA: DUF4410 domain-containing protein [Polyangiaceae bacterium]|nr:DUF4410 domain-containing protein [Polyangiaceae bacterium]
MWTRNLCTILACCAALWSCAHAKLGRVDVPLTGGVRKEIPILVETISSNLMGFSGDNAENRQRQAQERELIEQEYAPAIVNALNEKGFRAQLGSGGFVEGRALTLSGYVSEFEHGSKAARVMVGFGAGAAELYTHFTLTDNGNDTVVTEFEILSTSGGRSGQYGFHTSLPGHISDTADAVAQYLATGRYRR